MILVFRLDEVIKLYEHTKGAKEHSPTYSMLEEKQYWKPGAVPDEYGMVEGDDIDKTKVPAGFFLVKDEGVYLMSNGFPRQLSGDPKMPERSLVAYAEGLRTYGGKYDELVDEIGGDDFAEFVPLDWVSSCLDKKLKVMRIEMNADSFRILI